MRSGKGGTQGQEGTDGHRGRRGRRGRRGQRGQIEHTSKTVLVKNLGMAGWLCPEKRVRMRVGSVNTMTSRDPNFNLNIEKISCLDFHYS